MEPNSLHSSLAALGDYCRDLRSIGFEHLRVLQAENEGLKHQVEALSVEHAATTEALRKQQKSLVEAVHQATVANQRAAETADQLTTQQQAFEAGQAALRDEGQRLFRQLDDQSRTNQELQQQISSRVAEIDQLSSRLQRAEDAREASQKRTLELVHLLNVKAEALTQAEQASNDHQKHAEELQHQLTIRTAELDQLRHDVAWVGGEKVALQQRTSELELLLNTKAEVLSQAEQANNGHQKHAEELQHQLTIQTAELDQLRHDVAWVGGEKVALQQRTAELENLLNAKAEALNQAEQSRSDYQKHSEDLQHQLTIRTAEVSQLRDDLALVGGEKDAVHQRTVELEFLLHTQAEALTQTEQACNHQQKHAEDLEHQLITQTAKADQELTSQREAYAEAAATLEQLNHQIVVHKKQLLATSQRVELLDLQRAELQEELEAIFIADRQKKQQLVRLEEEVSSLHPQLDAAMQARDRQNDRVVELQRMLSAKDARLSEMERRYADQKRQLGALQSRNELLQIQAHELQDELEQTFLLAHGQESPTSDATFESQPTDQIQEPPQPVSASHAINNHRSRLLTAH